MKKNNKTEEMYVNLLIGGVTSILMGFITPEYPSVYEVGILTIALAILFKVHEK